MTRRERGRKGATPGGRPGAAGGMGARAGGEPNPCASIMAQREALVNCGQVALILRPGCAPEVAVTADNERQQAELSDLLGLARRLATLAGSVTT